VSHRPSFLRTVIKPTTASGDPHPDGCAIVKTQVRVAVEDQEPITEQAARTAGERLGFRQGPGRHSCNRFLNPTKRSAPISGLDLLPEVADAEHNGFGTVPGEQTQLVEKKWLAGNLEEGASEYPRLAHRAECQGRRRWMQIAGAASMFVEAVPRFDDVLRPLTHLVVDAAHILAHHAE